MNTHIELSFNYADLAPDLALVARAAAERIKARLSKSYIATGHDLIEVKNQLDHGKFGPWLTAEFGMAERTAEHYMNTARWLEGKSETLSVLPPTVLYALSAPSAPSAIVAEVVAAADAGTVMPVKEIKARMANAVQAERNAKIEAAKSPGQVKKERANEVRRRTAEKERQRKEQEDRQTSEVLRDEKARVIVRFLADRIGVTGVSDLLKLLHGTDWYRVERQLRHIREFREAAIEAKFQEGASPEMVQ